MQNIKILKWKKVIGDMFRLETFFKRDTWIIFARVLPRVYYPGEICQILKVPFE